MKLFKKNSTSQRIFKYVEEFQRATQNNDYRAALDAVEKALKIDPENKELLDMKATVLELIEMQNSRERPPSVSYTHLRAHETDSYLVCRLLLEEIKKLKLMRL